MRVKRTIRPKDNGTKKLYDKYGNKLLAVRYRYDKKTKMRYTTVELIIDKAPWNFNKVKK